MHRWWCSAPRQSGQCCEITADQSLFLFSSPSFDLPLGSHGIFDALEMLVEDEGYWSTKGGITVKLPCLVLCDPRFSPLARGADIVRAVGTAEYVKKSAHSSFSHRSSFETPLGSPQG